MKLLPDRNDAEAAMRAAYQYKDTTWGQSTWKHVVDCFNLGEYSNAIIFAWFICEQAVKPSQGTG